MPIDCRLRSIDATYAAIYPSARVLALIKLVGTAQPVSTNRVFPIAESEKFRTSSLVLLRDQTDVLSIYKISEELAMKNNSLLRSYRPENLWVRLLAFTKMAGRGNTRLRDAKWSLLIAHQPDSKPIAVAVLLHVAGDHNLQVRFKPDWGELIDEGHGQFWDEFGDDLSRTAQEMGAPQALELLEQTASHVLQLSPQRSTRVADVNELLIGLFNHHVMFEDKNTSSGKEEVNKKLLSFSSYFLRCCCGALTAAFVATSTFLQAHDGSRATSKRRTTSAVVMDETVPAVSPRMPSTFGSNNGISALKPL